MNKQRRRQLIMQVSKIRVLWIRVLTVVSWVLYSMKKLLVRSSDKAEDCMKKSKILLYWKKNNKKYIIFETKQSFLDVIINRINDNILLYIEWKSLYFYTVFNENIRCPDETNPISFCTYVRYLVWQMVCWVLLRLEKDQLSVYLCII